MGKDRKFMHKAREWLMSFNTSTPSNGKNHKATTISVTGGKGGVGKTSVALKFAMELAKMGRKTLLIDCDYNLSNTAIRLGLSLDNSNFTSLLKAEKSFDDCLYKEGNFHLLCACNGDLELFDSKMNLEELVLDIIAGHEEEYDFILLDCPAGIAKENMILNAYCDHRVVVVTPDRSSLTDSYSLIKVLNQRYGVSSNHLIVNMCLNSRQFKRVAVALSETCENFLGCRTFILGGLKKIEVEHSRFDHFFLKNDESAFHEKFLRIVTKYTDDVGRSRGDVLPSVPWKKQPEQEVQTLS